MLKSAFHQTGFKKITASMLVVILIFCLLPLTSAYAAPGAEDIKAAGKKIFYPQESSYFSEYKYGNIVNPKNRPVNLFFTPYLENQNYLDCIVDTLEDGEEVTLLAKQNKFYCLIGEDGIAGWLPVQYVENISSELNTENPDGVKDLLVYGDKFVVLYNNGSVKSLGGDYADGFGRTSGAGIKKFAADLSSWTQIKAICGDDSQIYGLKTDGTVLAAGRTYSGEDAAQLVKGWTGVKSISCNNYEVLGITDNAEVLRKGSFLNEKFSSPGWKNISKIYASCPPMGPVSLGLDSEGKVHGFADRELSEKFSGLKAFDSNGYCSVGIRKNGEIVYNTFSEAYEDEDFKPEDWKEVSRVYAVGENYFIGLTEDGHPLVYGMEQLKKEIEGWRDIESLNVVPYYYGEDGYGGIIGIRSDGSVVFSSDLIKDFKLPLSLIRELKGIRKLVTDRENGIFYAISENSEVFIISA